MKLIRLIILPVALLLIIISALAQDPNVKHFEKDGLTFDYPANWQISDQSTGQMQYVQLARDGYAEIRLRAPRDQYVDTFASQIQQAGMSPKRSTAATQISGADAQGARVRAVMDGEPGGMDSYFNIASDRLVQMSIIGSEKEIAKSAAVWDMIRNSLKVEPPPQPKASPSPKGKP